jgi:hypothetical protein
MASITRFLTERLRLKVNAAKSAVDRPWARTFLGYTMTAHKQPRLRVAVKSVTRLRSKLRTTLRHGRGRTLASTVRTLTPILRGWLQYFRLAEAKGVFEELDGWMRRRLRCVLWRQWKRPWTRRTRLMQRGLDPERAWRSASNGRGPWWNAGASHMNDAIAPPSSRNSACRPSSDCTATSIVLDEPPYTEPYVRWCGRGKPQGFLLPDCMPWPKRRSTSPLVGEVGSRNDPGEGLSPHARFRACG